MHAATKIQDKKIWINMC